MTLTREVPGVGAGSQTTLSEGVGGEEVKAVTINNSQERWLREKGLVIALQPRGFKHYWKGNKTC